VLAYVIKNCGADSKPRAVRSDHRRVRERSGDIHAPRRRWLSSTADEASVGAAPTDRSPLWPPSLTGRTRVKNQDSDTAAPAHPLRDELREGIHVIIVCRGRKRTTLIQKVVHPLAPRNQTAIAPRVR